MSKYNLQDLLEGMSDKEFADAQEKDRLEKHPERDKIKAIQALLAKEKNKANESKKPSQLSPDDQKELKFHIQQFKKGNIDRDELLTVFDQFGLGDYWNRDMLSVDEDLFSPDSGTEDNVDNIDKVASPSAKGKGYSSAVGAERSEDDKEQSDITQTTKPMYEDMNLISLAKKLGIDVDDLKDRVSQMKSKEKDEIEASAKKAVAEARVDRDVADRIEGLLNQPMKKKFLDTFMDLWQDLIEEDPFYAEDVINHLNNEMHKEIDGYQAMGDRLNSIPMEENGHVDDYAEELSEASEEESIADYIVKYYTNPKTGEEIIGDDIVMSYFKTHPEYMEDGRWDGSDEGMKDGMDDFQEFLLANYDFPSSLDEDKSLKEHFKRFM
jgi:hypothetical protein